MHVMALTAAQRGNRGTLLRGLRRALLPVVSLFALSAGAAFATQTVDPYDAPTLGNNLNGTTVTVGSGGTVTFYGRYSDTSTTGFESGLGVKVKYDGTKLINATITEEFQKCRIGVAQIQNPTLTNAQAVMGWLDTTIWPSGSVATATGEVRWPDAAQVSPTLCLNPGGINTADTAAVTPPMKLFKFTATRAAGFTSGTTTVSIEADNNFSYAGTTPGFTAKSFTVSAVAAGTIALIATDPIVSRKIHAAAPATTPVFEIPLALGVNTATTVTTEPRLATANAPHRIVFKFDQAVTSATVVATNQTGGAVAATGTASGTEYIVDLSGVVNGSRVTVQLSNVNGLGVSAGITLGFLAGDVNGNRAVQGSDVTFVQQRLLAPLSATNFKADINVNGNIQGSDVTAAQQRLLTTLQ